MSAIVVSLDEIGDLNELARSDTLTVGVVTGECTGVRLAAACAVDLLYCTPDACFGRAESWTDYVLHRASALIGRRTAGYLAMSGRMLPAQRLAGVGFVNAIADAPHERAREVAELIEQRPAAATRIVLAQTNKN